MGRMRQVNKFKSDRIKKKYTAKRKPAYYLQMHAPTKSYLSYQSDGNTYGPWPNIVHAKIALEEWNREALSIVREVNVKLRLEAEARNEKVYKRKLAPFYTVLKKWE